MPVFTCSWFYLINTKTKSFLHCGRVRRCHESALITSIFWNPSFGHQLTCAEAAEASFSLGSQTMWINWRATPKESHDLDCWLKKPFLPLLTWPHMWLDGPHPRATHMGQASHVPKQTLEYGRPVPQLTGCAQRGFWEMDESCFSSVMLRNLRNANMRVHSNTR